MKYAFIGVMTWVLAAVSAPAALAEQAAGMVVSISGTTAPALRPFTEIPHGSTITLGPQGQLSFVHYRTCRIVSVVGGTVTIQRTIYDIGSGGRIVTVAERKCPQQVKLAEPKSGEAAGLMMRSAILAPTLSTRPSIVFVGKNAERVVNAEVRRGEASIALMPVENRRARWPESAPGLSAGADYKLVLRTREGGTVEYSFTAVEAAAKDEGRSVEIIRVD